MEEREFSGEFIFIASRSSGPGGQHVNKTSSRIELRFNIYTSRLLVEEEKQLLLEKLGHRISKEGILRIVSQKERSQRMNKQQCIRKFYLLLEQTLKKETPRKKSRPSKSSIEKIKEEKKRKAEKKTVRAKIKIWEV
jgi:ribosome-associated protein